MKESTYQGAERVKEAHLFLNAFATRTGTLTRLPQERLHVWIAVLGDGTCALKLYLDLLWTVWYRKRERGLNLSVQRMAPQR